MSDSQFHYKKIILLILMLTVVQLISHKTEIVRYKHIKCLTENSCNICIRINVYFAIRQSKYFRCE